MTTNNDETCEYCGREFFAERITKRYCSDSCRQLAYLARRANKLANASFVEETSFESIPAPIPEQILQEILDEKPLETETVIDEPNTERSNRTYVHSKRRRRSKFSMPKNKPDSIDDGLLLIGVAAAGFLIGKYLNKPKNNTQTTEPEKKEEKSPESELPMLKLNVNQYPTPIKSEGISVPTGKMIKEDKGLPSFESLKLPSLDTNAEEEAKN
jgi:wobble nucleotide-excising tRNase